LDSDYQKYINANPTHITVNEGPIVRKEAEDVFSFPFLTAEFCEKLVSEIEAYRKATKDSGVALRVSKFGFEPTVKMMIKHHLSSVITTLYPKLKNVNYEVYPKVVSITSC
jgi:hypothetical protein